MANAIERLEEIRDNVEADSLNTEKYVKELSQVMMNVTALPQKQHEAPCDSEPEGREWRHVVVQTMTPSIHNGVGIV